jgi:4-hydroxy-3-methylbut-2-enyl diphosphate reductase
MSIEKVLTVSPRGFCAGVTRSIQVVEDCLKIFGAPIYVKHSIVHNKSVVADLEKKGAITVERVAEIPVGAVAIFSAHGSPPEHFAEAKERNIQVIDATCPLVTKVHLEIIRYIQDGFKVVYIGHRGHIEGVGVVGEVLKFNVEVPIIDKVEEVADLSFSENDKIAILTQTTLNIEKTNVIIQAIKEKFSQVVEPPAEDICYATTNRQHAVKQLARQVDLILVVGSKASSNSNRLAEVAKEGGASAVYLIDEVGEIKEDWLVGHKSIGVTSGASAPEYRVQEIIDYFVQLGAEHQKIAFQEENLDFTEPIELMKIKKERNFKG